ncbi:MULTISPECIES: CBS domain-containing protein [Methanobrevibacter]|uniref:CBS domain-containing protein n=1 Tax=Methanobrevibacter TaxID=2172 RepID=UPI0015C1913A|nr:MULTISPECIES: CBS domain-containing protein [Methanobrevibacter]MBS7258729.1 CBS domain-containing protein [Methanobrevibacter sp.]MCI7428353.1 CBS domain-containing protein [Methanobrevibacter sp.]MDD6776045.1 CBS domain-containing protein [Methanobacteriaceae archaeon]MDY3097115.1 CBS domain-containing protein [Methanobrevibacter sp.]
MMLSKKVKEIMTSDVVTTTSDVDVVFAFEKLMENKISSLPVVEDDKLIGIITATDVGHNLILDKYELGTNVEKIMITPVITISPENTLEDAIKVMKDNVSSGILNQLPVVEDGKLVGIISDGDIIQELF